MSKNTDTTLSLYEDFDLEALAEDKEDAKAASTGGKRLGALPEGKTVLRVFPAKRGSSHSPKPWRAIFMHYVDVPGLEQSVNFVCPRVEAKSTCVVCTRAKRMMASGNETDEKRGRNLMPKRRLFANVINRGAPEDGVKVWEFGKMVLEQLQEIRDEEGLGLNFTHPDVGYDLFVMRKGKKLDTEYKISVSPASIKTSGCRLSDDPKQQREWLEQMHSLDAMAKVYTPEEINDMLAGKKAERGRGDAPRGRSVAEVVEGQVAVDEEDE